MSKAQSRVYPTFCPTTHVAYFDLFTFFSFPPILTNDGVQGVMLAKSQDPDIHVTDHIGVISLSEWAQGETLT